MARDKVEAKAEIQLVLDRFAEEHGVTIKDVNHAMDYVDDMLSDLFYEVERETNREIEENDPVE